MATITIKNVGPIKNVENLELNKVNVFMGPQCSGKSTIAKIISYCTWVEKRHMLDGFFRENFYERLKTFHNFDDTYFVNKDAYIKYEGDYFSIEFLKKDYVIKQNSQFEQVENRKLIFIPAERNFVASIPNLGRYKETNNNVMDFLYYWYEAKKHYPKNNMLNIPALGISYYHIENEDKDVIVLNNKKEIALQSASSGFQSMIPLYLLMDYLTNILYKKEIIPSPFEIEQIEELANPLIESQMQEYVKPLLEIMEKISERGITDKYISAVNKFKEEGHEKWLDQIVDLYKKRLNYKYSQFIIEEPEQNLFPSTQRDLVYHLLQLITGERDHRLTITTHSPYILYALNNCMMGYLVKEKMLQEEDYADLKSLKASIDPTKVSVWQITDEGTIKNIQGEDNLIEENYFDACMKDVMDDYYKMINYYGDDDENEG